MASILRSFLIDGMVICGSASVTYGTWLMYQPAGFVVGGLILSFIGLAIAASSRKAK